MIKISYPKYSLQTKQDFCAYTGSCPDYCQMYVLSEIDNQYFVSLKTKRNSTQNAMYKKSVNVAKFA